MCLPAVLHVLHVNEMARCPHQVLGEHFPDFTSKPDFFSTPNFRSLENPKAPLPYDTIYRNLKIVYQAVGAEVAKVAHQV